MGGCTSLHGTTYLRTDNTKKRIVSIQFVRDVDVDGDTSNLGICTDCPGPTPADRVIDRVAIGHVKLNLLRCSPDFRYFVAAMSANESGNPDSVRQDYDRAEAFNRQEWHMVFCQAVATVSVGGVMQKITSGGLGDVESDSGEDYFAHIKDEQMDELRLILDELGFPESEVEAAVEKA